MMTRGYVVFELQYNNCHTGMRLIKEDNIQNFCLEQLSEYYRYSKKKEKAGNSYDFVKQEFIHYDLSNLIRATVNKGNKHVYKQRGFGVIYIVKGDNLVIEKYLLEKATFG